MSVTNERLSVLEYLVRNSPNRWIGRTALMKLCYFAQVLRSVPLGYNFSLYSYGPFDSAVLSDLGEAEALGVLKEGVTNYPSGYGYQISSAMAPENLPKIESELLRKNQEDLDFVLGEYGNSNAADLELASTLIFADREAAENNERISTDDLARRVKEVKPRFPIDYITKQAEVLKEKRFFNAVV